jgi:predicted metal-dependent enzyme (double-stranded beta helix superfamily)
MTTSTTFDLDDFLAACQAAMAEGDARRAVREVVQRAVSAPTSVGDALQPELGGFTLLHHASDLTVLHVVWAPGMRIYPHDHRMWATIGIYAGQEDNAFYRRAGTERRDLVESGGKELRVGDVVTLGDDTIHAVTNPTSRLTGAIHVYGGDFVNEPRSQWGPGDLVERPYDVVQAQQEFLDANEAWLGRSPH